MMKLVTETERHLISSKLDRDRRKLNTLMATILVHLYEYAMGEGQKHVRLVVERPGKVKSLIKIIGKINKKRAEGENYEYEKLDDLVGAKILCPYDSDVEVVCQWLTRPGQPFEVKESCEEAMKKMEEKHKGRGYRGLHFELSIPQIADSLKFELQLKSLLAEAWDVWTHDIRYKPETALSDELNRHITLLGHMLGIIDEQSVIVKNQILAAEEEKQERWRAATQVHLFEVVSRDPETFDKIGLDIKKFDSAIDTPRILETLKEIEAEKGLCDIICRSYALLALLDGAEEHKKNALAKAEEFRFKEPDNSETYVAQASVCWSLGEVFNAITIVEKGIENFEDDKRLKEQFCYFVSDCEDTERKDKAEEYLQTLSEELGTKDTKAFFLIVFGDTEDKIDEGRHLLREVLRDAQKEEPRIQELAKAFYQKHEQYALLKLSRMLQEKTA